METRESKASSEFTPSWGGSHETLSLKQSVGEEKEKREKERKTERMQQSV